ncbi:Ger(x)C family spore germination protein [Alteribacillus sp. JSM 102045]|uniref:Ger(x)C family spore germination protein n=1 Tax=Alteribacillus sp. JSM 102045 TaxID=1562101 RepID=UPI0035C004B1
MKRCLFLLLVCSTFFLSGCWSNDELSDLALVSALGVDKTDDGQYVGTVQVINPGNVAGEGKQGTGGSESAPVTSYSEIGTSLIEVNRRLSTKVSRQLYYAHTNLFIIGEKLAREEGVMKIFDALERDPEFRTTTRIIIAQGVNAADIIKTLTPLDKIPSNKVIKTMELTERFWGEHLNVETRDVLKKLTMPGQEPVITCFTMSGDPEEGEKLESIQETVPNARFQATGIAIFKDGKMIDIINGDLSKGTVWVLDKIKETAVAVDWEEEKDSIVYRSLRQNTNVKASVKNKNKPEISVEVAVEGGIGETSKPVDLSNPHILIELEDLIEKEIKENIMSSVNKAQELQTDFLGFGEAVHRADPQAWKQMKHAWNKEYFPDLEVNITVDAFVRRTGLRNKPFFSNMEG